MTDEHKCLHEVDFAIMAERVEENVKDTKQILTILQGDNGIGLKTEVELLKQDQKRSRWWLKGITAAILGLAFYAIRALIAG